MLTEALKNRIEQELKTLGDNPQIIAKSLKNLGIKGRCDTPHECPIARFLVKYVRVDPVVGDRYIRIGNDNLATPLPVVRFINLFDQGLYPELIVWEIAG